MEYSADAPALIESEEDAWKLISEINSGKATFSSLQAIKFKGWPRIEAYVPDHRLDGALTPYMMQGFIDLQRSVFRSYAVLVKGDSSARVLSDEEKNRLELVVDVDEGSSDNSIDFWRAVLEIGNGMVSKMDPTHLVLMILGLSLIYAGQSVCRAYFQKEKDEKIAEIQSKQVVESLEALKFANETDLERMKILAEAMKATPQLAPIADDADDARQSLVRHMTKDTDARVNGVEMPQTAGQRLTRNTRSSSKDIRLDGVYKINHVDATTPDGFRVKLENVETGQEFYAGVQDALLSEEHKTIMQNAEWKKVPVRAEINAKIKKDEIFEAIVLSVTEHK